VALALSHRVAVGAHPGYADRAHFGRDAVELPLEEVRALVVYQVGALDGFLRARGGRLVHVKAHGALYNRAAKDRALAVAVAEAVHAYRSDLILVGLAGSVQLEAARAIGLRAAGEAFADRRYLPDGSLMPRSQPGAVLHDAAETAEQAARIAEDGYAVARANRCGNDLSAWRYCRRGGARARHPRPAGVEGHRDCAALKLQPLLHDEVVHHEAAADVRLQLLTDRESVAPISPDGLFVEPVHPQHHPRETAATRFFFHVAQDHRTDSAAVLRYLDVELVQLQLAAGKLLVSAESQRAFALADELVYDACSKVTPELVDVVHPVQHVFDLRT